MPYIELPDFMSRLRARQGIAARALEFAILTVLRTSEVIGTRWDEIDLDRAVWNVPAERMKKRRPHRVPLSERALAILAEMGECRSNEFVFPGQKPGRPMSSLETVLKRMGINAATVHGFRSSLRDWAAECTTMPNEVCEAALAHVIENKAEAAYRRGDLFAKRRTLMDAWAAYAPGRHQTASSLSLRSPGVPRQAHVLPSYTPPTAAGQQRRSLPPHPTFSGRCSIRHASGSGRCLGPAPGRNFRHEFSRRTSGGCVSAWHA